MRTPPSLILLIVVAAATVTGAQPQEGFRFKSGVEFVNVTATVTDGNGRCAAARFAPEARCWVLGDSPSTQHLKR